MITAGKPRRLIIDSFIIGVIIAIVVNAYLLIDLFRSPFIEMSENTKLASTKWKQLTDTAGSASDNLSESAETEKIIARLEHQAKTEKTPPMPETQDNRPEEQGTASVPRLTGILQVVGAGKSPRFLALMEGKRLQKHDKIMGFTVESITAGGVVLAKNGQARFIPAPNVFFSLGREQAPAEAKSR